MTEHLPPLNGEQKTTSTRRSFVTGLAAVAFALAADRGLSELRTGIRLNAPPLYMQTREFIDIELLSEIDGGTFSKSIDKQSGGRRLLFDPTGEFFIPGREFGYIHRGGNGLEDIERAYQVAVNEMEAGEVEFLLFDVDLGEVQGKYYAEHGLIPRFEIKIGRRAIGVHYGVVDVGEKEIALNLPDTYESVVEFVGSLGYPFAISVELKRGEYGPDEVKDVIDIHQRRGVPVVMQSPNPEQLLHVGNEVAAYYNSWA